MNMHVLNCFREFDIILASQSPRRKDLLENADIPFRVLVRPTPEVFSTELDPVEVVQLLCREKAHHFQNELNDPRVVVITADTIVVHKGQIINKPKDPDDAFNMLSSLSGNTHEVYTGVCIRHQSVESVFYDHSLVTFRAFTPEEIWYYIEKYAPFDKAGAYGIQDWIGTVGITEIKGSHHNVMGLPVHMVYTRLKEMLCRISSVSP